MALTKPFCENGDKTTIPPTTNDGSVSYNLGFTYAYALPPEEGGKFIDRAQFNQLMFDTTSEVLANKAAIATKANTSEVVKLTTNQNIQGVKTFASPPVSATNPKADNQVANKAYVDSVGNTAVKLTGTQRIEGAKTFTSNITAPNITQMQNSINTLNGKVSTLETQATKGVSYLSSYVNWDIGPGGDYETIAEALTEVKKYNSTSNRTITLKLNDNYAGGEDLRGFVGDYSFVVIDGQNKEFNFDTFFIKIYNISIRITNINIINANETVIEIGYCPQVRIDNLKINAGSALPLSILSSKVLIVGDTCTLNTTNANVVLAESSIVHIRASGAFSSTSQNFSLVLGAIVSSNSPATANIAKNTPTVNGIFLN